MQVYHRLENLCIIKQRRRFVHKSACKLICDYTQTKKPIGLKFGTKLLQKDSEEVCLSESLLEMSVMYKFINSQEIW